MITAETAHYRTSFTLLAACAAVALTLVGLSSAAATAPASKTS